MGVRVAPEVSAGCIEVARGVYGASLAASTAAAHEAVHEQLLYSPTWLPLNDVLHIDCADGSVRYVPWHTHEVGARRKWPTPAQRRGRRSAGLRILGAANDLAELSVGLAAGGGVAAKLGGSSLAAHLLPRP